MTSQGDKEKLLDRDIKPATSYIPTTAAGRVYYGEEIGVPIFRRKHISWSRVVGVFLFLTLLAVSVACLVVGVITWDTPCSTHRFSTFLVVAGVLGILSNLISPISLITAYSDEDNIEHDYPHHQAQYFKIACKSCVVMFFNLVSLGWLITGSVWIYSYDPGSHYQYCDKFLYIFTFWIITGSYSLFGFYCLLCSVLSFANLRF